MASKICKIVYFDEDSVTDYVQIVAGGTLEKTTELLNSSDLSEEQKFLPRGESAEYLRPYLVGKRRQVAKFLLV